MADWVIIGLLAVGCLMAVLLTAVRLPGTWLIVVAAGLFGWWDEWQRVGVGLVAALIGVALIGELVELLASVFTARRAGATRQAAWGGLIGGILGMFLFSLPMPVIGTMAGAAIGCTT